MSTILKSSFEHLCIINCPASSTTKGLLGFMRKRATTSCNCSGSFAFIHLLCFGICAVLEAKQTGSAITSRRGVHRWAGADFVPLMGCDSQRLAWHSHPVVTLMATVAVIGGWVGGAIKYLCVCRVQALWTGKKHYFWVVAKAAAS